MYLVSFPSFTTFFPPNIPKLKSRSEEKNFWSVHNSIESSSVVSILMIQGWKGRGGGRGGLFGKTRRFVIFEHWKHIRGSMSLRERKYIVEETNSKRGRERKTEDIFYPHNESIRWRKKSLLVVWLVWGGSFCLSVAIICIPGSCCFRMHYSILISS